MLESRYTEVVHPMVMMRQRSKGDYMDVIEVHTRTYIHTHTLTHIHITHTHTHTRV